MKGHSNGVIGSFSIKRYLHVITILLLAIIAVKLCTISDCLCKDQGIINGTDSKPQKEVPKYEPHHKTMYTSGTKQIYMHAAFLDDRYGKKKIRIFGLAHKSENVKVYKCKWETQSRLMEVKSVGTFIDKSWPQWCPYFAVDFECELPKNEPVPHLIALVSENGEYSYEMPITFPIQAEKQKTLAVCVKPVTGSFPVAKVVEWFELQRLVGLNDFIVFDTEITGASRFAFDYYKKMGILRLPSFPFLMAILQTVNHNSALSPEDLYAVYQQVYIVAMHDCLYRYRLLYRNILYIDVDEVLLPSNNQTLIEVTENINKHYTYGAGFMFLTAWHFEDHGAVENVPDYLYMQKYSKASKPIDNQPKSIVHTGRALSMNFHSVLDVPEKKYSNEIMPETFAYLHHYRGNCRSKFGISDCRRLLSDVRMDPIMPKYRENLKTNVKKVLDILQLK